METLATQFAAQPSRRYNRAEIYALRRGQIKRRSVSECIEWKF
jgi:hypothetical protein